MYKSYSTTSCKTRQKLQRGQMKFDLPSICLRSVCIHRPPGCGEKFSMHWESLWEFLERSGWFKFKGFVSDQAESENWHRLLWNLCFDQLSYNVSRSRRTCSRWELLIEVLDSRRSTHESFESFSKKTSAEETTSHNGHVATVTLPVTLVTSLMSSGADRFSMLNDRQI